MPTKRDGYDDAAVSSLLRPPPPMASSAGAAATRSRNNSITGVAVQAAAIASRNSPYLRSGPLATGSSTSLSSLLLRSTSGDDVVVSGQPVNAVDAPYLSTTEAHLGRMTLTAPDNMRRRKAEEREKRQKARKRKAERAEVASNALMSHAAGALSASPMNASTARQRPTLTATRSTSNLHSLQTLETQRSRSPTRPPRPRSAQNATRSDTSPERRPAAVMTATISTPSVDAASPPRPGQRRVRRRRRREERPVTGPTDESQSRRSSAQAQDSAAGVRAEALRRVTQRRRDIYADLPAMGLPGASDSEPDDAPPPFPSYATRPVSPPAMPAEGEEWTEEMRRRQEEYTTNRPPDSPPPAFLSGGEDGATAQRQQRQAASSPEPSSDDDGAAQEAISEERRLWEEDVAAGFSFEKRVERERVRRQAKETELPVIDNDEQEAAPAAVLLPNSDLGQMVMEARARRNQGQAEVCAQDSVTDLPPTVTTSASPAAPPTATAKIAAKKVVKKSSAHRRTVSDGQGTSTPQAAPIEPPTGHRNAAIGTGKGLTKSAGPVAADSGAKVISLRVRPASESHSRFRDDASAAANRRLALWGPKLDEAAGSGSSASESMRSQLYSVKAPVTLRSRSTTDVADRLQGLFDEEQRATSAASMRRHETSSSSGPATHDGHDSSDSDAAWEKEEKQFKRLQQVSAGRAVIVDSSDDEAAEDGDDAAGNAADGARMPGNFSAAKRRADVELPELGKVGSTIPRAPPPLALGRSRGGGAAYSSSSESSSESDANQLESDSDSPPDMDEVVSMSGHDEVVTSAGTPLADKGKQPMRPLPAVPLDSSSSSRSAWPADHTNVHRAGTFQEDSGSSRDFSDESDDEDEDAYVEAEEHSATRHYIQNASDTSRPQVQNRLKELFAAQLSPSVSQGALGSSTLMSASRASLGSLFDTPIGDIRAGASAQPRRPSKTASVNADSLEQRIASRSSIESPAFSTTRQPRVRQSSSIVDEQQARSEALQSISRVQRSQDALPEGVDRDSLAALERLLARTAPAVRPSSNSAEALTSEPSKLTRSGAIGSRQMASSAFVNPRTLNAPRPLGRLPTITDATRHFPAAQRPSPTPSNASVATGDSSITARPVSMYMLPPPAMSDRARPVSQIGTPSWMAYIPASERRALPTPLEPDRRTEAALPPPRIPSPTRSITGSRVNAMVIRFEQQMVGNDAAETAAPLRPSSPMIRAEEPVDHLPVRRRPPPPPPPSAWSSYRKAPVSAHEVAAPSAPTPAFDERRPSNGVYGSAQAPFPAERQASMFAMDPTAAGELYGASAVAPSLPPRPRLDVGTNGFASPTVSMPLRSSVASPPAQPTSQLARVFASPASSPLPAPPRPAPTEPITNFGKLYSSEERSRSASSLFSGSRPLPVPPRVEVTQTARRQEPPPVTRRPSTPRSFFVDEAARSEDEEEEEVGEEQRRARSVVTSMSSAADGRRTESLASRPADIKAAQEPATNTTPTPLPRTSSPLQEPQTESSDPTPSTAAVAAAQSSQPRRAPSLGYTDLDLFASRLADVRAAAPNGEDSSATNDDDGVGSNRRDTYDDLHLLAEFLGPAKAPGLTQEQMETLPVGRVEVLRRRVVGKRDDGRDKVKLALAVTGLKVERCGVCLVQFKEGNLACVFPCLHVLHEQCAIKLLRNTKVCPICRSPVILDA